MSYEGFFRPTAPHAVGVYRAQDIRVIYGTNRGDAVGLAEDLFLDDEFALAEGTRLNQLAMQPLPRSGHFRVSDTSALGTPGASLHFDASLAFMAPNGTLIEALTIVELEQETGCVAQTYLMPFTPLAPHTVYTLINIETRDLLKAFASLACVSFAKGTRITLATGLQRPVEALAVGDMVLTRNNGPQPIRWIGHVCHRAQGAFSPVHFAPGAIHNNGPLLLSPNQRLFFYQREDKVGAGQAEVLIRADKLVNGDTITRQEGGFQEYFQILLDGHEYLYAEGVATESLTLDPSTLPAVPDALADRQPLADAVEAGISMPVELHSARHDDQDVARLLCDASTS